MQIVTVLLYFSLYSAVNGILLYTVQRKGDNASCRQNSKTEHSHKYRQFFQVFFDYRFAHYLTPYLYSVYNRNRGSVKLAETQNRVEKSSVLLYNTGNIMSNFVEGKK